MPYFTDSQVNRICDPETERKLIGKLIIDPEAIRDVLQDGLSADDFYIEKNGIIFSALIEMHRQSRPIDAVTVRSYLTDTGSIDKAGGVLYLLELEKSVVNNALDRIANDSAFVEEYARIVRSRSLYRMAIAAAETMVEEIINGKRSPAEVIADLIKTEMEVHRDLTKHNKPRQ